jgi:hypothetical protein
MDSETLKDVEHLLDDQLPKIRHAFEEAAALGCKDPVVWLFNLDLENSLEVACGIFGEYLREQLEDGASPEAIRSCLLPTERQDAIDTLAARLPSTGAHKMLGTPQAPETIRVLVFYGPDLSVFDVPRSAAND